MPSDSVSWSKVNKNNVSYNFDIVLFWLALGLLGLGVVMVYSSSIAIGQPIAERPTHFGAPAKV